MPLSSNLVSTFWRENSNVVEITRGSLTFEKTYLYIFPDFSLLLQYDGQSKLPLKISPNSQVHKSELEDIGTCTISFNQRTTKSKLETLLQHLLWDNMYAPLKILRFKANVNLVSDKDDEEIGNYSALVQGVNDTYDIYKTDINYEESIFVIIAKSIDVSVLQTAIYSTLKCDS